MPLSDTTIKTAKAAEKPYKLADYDGLFLFVAVSGSKFWRFKYRIFGKEKLLILGRYPEMGLKAARAKRDEARELVSKGQDPSVEKKKAAVAASIQAGNTFKAVADEYIQKIEADGIAPATKAKTIWLAKILENEIGNRPVAEIEPFEILAVLRKVEKRGNLETAHRLRSLASRVFRYAIWTTRARLDPTANLGGALRTPRVKHHAAIIEPDKAGELLRSIEGFQGHMTTHAALRLAPYVFVRPTELRHAEWSEFDFEERVWRIPAAKMKMKREHFVPLSRQAVQILTEIREISGAHNYVFPSVRTWQRPMSENTINVALRRLGYTSDEMTGHGFRSMASTLLNESRTWQPDAIEAALAHQDKNNVRRAYNRGAYWAERVEMVQWWADYLDRLRDGVIVTKLVG
jgi:integrase